MRKLPSGHLQADTTVRSAADIGRVVRQTRQHQKLRQLDLAGLANSGNRFIVELEKGKPSVQLQKVLEILGLLGLEVILRRRGASGGF